MCALDNDKKKSLPTRQPKYARYNRVFCFVKRIYKRLQAHHIAPDTPKQGELAGMLLTTLSLRPMYFNIIYARHSSMSVEVCSTLEIRNKENAMAPRDSW